MSRIDEIARYHTAEELFEIGMDYLNGTNGKVRIQETAEKYFNAAADKGSRNAVIILRELETK